MTNIVPLPGFVSNWYPPRVVVTFNNTVFKLKRNRQDIRTQLCALCVYACVYSVEGEKEPAMLSVNF